MKNMIFCVACAVLCTAVARAAEGDAGGKVVLRLSSIETADTRVDKAFDIKPLPPVNETTLPYTEAMLANLSGRRLHDALDENARVRHENNAAKRAIFMKRFLIMEKRQKDMLEKYQNTPLGRYIVTAGDLFVGEMGPYLDKIALFHQMDMAESAMQAELRDDAVDFNEKAYFIKLVLQSQDDRNRELQMPGGLTVNKHECQMVVTVEVEDYGGNIIFSKNVEESITINATSAGASSGGDAIIRKTLKKAMATCAKEIDAYFTASVEFEIVGPKNDEDFDENAVTVSIDGEEVDCEEVIRLTKGTHEVKAELDGYHQKGSSSIKFDKSGKKKIVMLKDKKAVEEE